MLVTVAREPGAWTLNWSVTYSTNGRTRVQYFASKRSAEKEKKLLDDALKGKFPRSDRCTVGDLNRLHEFAESAGKNPMVEPC